MSKLITSNTDYANWVASLKQRYRSAQIKASVKVNTEVLHFYWELGHDIVEQQMENTYGSRFFSQLSTDLQRELPDIKGFSPTNIKYCKYFYELYSPLFQNRQLLVDDFESQNHPQHADDFPYATRRCSTLFTTIKICTNR